jgi:hypothetical protein
MVILAFYVGGWEMDEDFALVVCQQLALLVEI